jgi:hypothetical protein
MPPTAPSSGTAGRQETGGNPGHDVGMKLLMDTLNENVRRRTPTSSR